MLHVHKEVAQVDPMAHPLIGDTARKLFVQAKLEIKLRVEGPVGLGHQPGAPVRVLFTNHLYFGAPAPAWSMIIPLNLVLTNISKDTRANQVARGKLIRFAAVLRANLRDEIPGNNGIASPLDFLENISHGLFAIGILARF